MGNNSRHWYVCSKCKKNLPTRPLSSSSSALYLWLVSMWRSCRRLSRAMQVSPSPIISCHNLVKPHSPNFVFCSKIDTRQNGISCFQDKSRSIHLQLVLCPPRWAKLIHADTSCVPLDAPCGCSPWPAPCAYRLARDAGHRLFFPRKRLALVCKNIILTNRGKDIRALRIPGSDLLHWSSSYAQRPPSLFILVCFTPKKREKKDVCTRFCQIRVSWNNFIKAAPETSFFNLQCYTTSGFCGKLHNTCVWNLVSMNHLQSHNELLYEIGLKNTCSFNRTRKFAWRPIEFNYIVYCDIWPSAKL